MEETIKVKPHENNDYVHKKLAAIELHKVQKKLFSACLVGIAGTVVPTIFASFNNWAGAAAAMIFAGVLAIVSTSALRQIKYLEQRYELKKGA